MRLTNEEIVARQISDSDLDLNGGGVPTDGMLIVFEGPDGAGKTLIAKLLTEQLREASLIASYVRTPGGTPVGEKLRKILLFGSDEMSDLTEALIFQAQLSQCITEIIKPRLQRGEVVICDRLILSTLAYQGAGRQMDLGFLHDLQTRTLQGVWPDLGFLLTNPVETPLDEKDRMEGAGKDFLERVGAFYKHCINQDNGLVNWMVPITVNTDPQETLHQLLPYLAPFIGKLVSTTKGEKPDA